MSDAIDERRGFAIVPTEAHVEAFSAAGVRAMTLRRLTTEGAAAECPRSQPTTPEVTRLLIARIRGVSIEHAHAVDQSIGRLRRAGTRPTTLQATGLSRGRSFGALLEDLDRSLERHSLYDDRASPWLAARSFSASNAALLPSGSVYVRGLSSWDNATLHLLETLHERLRRQGFEGVCLELPSYDRGPLKEAAEALAAELEARWAPAPDPPSLAFVPSDVLSPERTHWVEAYDAASEARAVTRSVLDALARGTPLDRIAIVPVDLEEAFLEPLRFELTRAKIPFAEPRGRPAIAAPRAHAAIELLRLARGPLSRDMLVDVLRLPELQLKPWFGEHAPRVGALLHELSDLPLRFDRTGTDLMDELEDQLVELARDDAEEAARLLPLRDGLGAWLDALRTLAEPGPRTTLVTRASGFFEKLGLTALSETTLARALGEAAKSRPELLHALGHDAAGVRALRLALERVSSAAHAIGAADDAIALGTLLDELALALEGISPTGGAIRAAAVRIARPQDIAGLPFDFVALCRASDKSLDARGRGDPGLGPELEAALPAAERPQSALSEQRFAWLAVGWALCRAKRVVVSWASHDAARTLAPSRLARLLMTPDRPGRTEPASALLPRARRTQPIVPLSPGGLHRVSVERKRASFFADPDAPLDSYNGAAGSLVAFLGDTTQRPLGVTALERSLRCAFLGFASIVLGATRKDTVEDAISARERGSLLHAALAVALSSVRDQLVLRAPAQLEAMAFERARVFLEQRGRSPLRRAGIETTLTDVGALLRKLFSEDSEYRFRHAEQAFGREAPWTALSVGKHQVTGRIDRIDVSSDGKRVRVIDYKTRLPTGADQERALQPLLYAHKAAQELSAEHVEFAYVALSGRIPKIRSVYEGPPDSEEIRAGLARAAFAIDALEQGLVPARPASSADCPRCAARDICRRPLSAPENPES